MCGLMFDEPMDVAVVTCKRDIHLLKIMLISYSIFSQIRGTLFIFCDDDDVLFIKDLPLPNKCVIMPKGSIPDLCNNDFANQMYIKLNIDKYCHARYVWMIDSDYLLTVPLSEHDFFKHRRLIWLYRPWDNEASLRWHKPTADFLGFDPPYQFMERAQYVFVTEILREIRTKVDTKTILSADEMPSEFVFYGSYCYRHAYNTYEWQYIPTGLGSLSYEVTQRPPTYDFLNNDTNINDSGESKYCVFWSHWARSEVKMIEFLIDACARAHVKPKDIDLETLLQEAYGRALDVLDDRLEVVNADREAKDELIARLTASLAAVETDRCDKDVLIERLVGDLAVVEADRRAKDDLIEHTTSDLAAVEFDRRAKNELIDRMAGDLVAVKADRIAKDTVIERLTGDLAAVNVDRRAKDDVIQRVMGDFNAVEADRRAKDELIQRVMGDFNAVEADRRAKDELIQRVTNDLAAVDADRRAKDEVIQRLVGELTAVDADRRAKDEVIQRLVGDLAAVEADRRAKDEVIQRLVGDLVSVKTAAAQTTESSAASTAN